MDKFNIAYQITLKIEAGYSNISSDKGGETYNGISRKNWLNWEGWKIIDEYKKTHEIKRGEIILNNVLKDMVYSFYKVNFFDINRLGEINNQSIINELFDTGVNMGTKIAVKFVQKSLNLLNRNQKDYEDISEDGILGSTTLRLINNYKYPDVLTKTLNGFQFMRYVEICENDPSQEENFRGWLTRVTF